MKEVITNANSEQVKLLKKLSRKKYREQYSKYIIESRKLINEAIDSGIEIEKIYVREGMESVFKDCTFLSKQVFNLVSSLQTPDGYLAIVRKKEKFDISEKILILDKIQDPGNMGTLIRSAEAFGFNTILAIDSVDFYNEKVLRATMGSAFRLNLIESNYEFVQNLENYTIIIADMDGEDYRKIELNGNVAIVIGNEGNGISEEIQNSKHITVKIPMQGKIESLNAGVSGSILMSKF